MWNCFWKIVCFAVDAFWTWTVNHLKYTFLFFSHEKSYISFKLKVWRLRATNYERETKSVYFCSFMLMDAKNLQNLLVVVLVKVWVHWAFVSVSLQRCGLTKWFVTELALERSFPGVRSLVTTQAGLFVKSFITNETEMSFLFCMLFLMKDNGISIGESKKKIIRKMLQIWCNSQMI